LVLIYDQAHADNVGAEIDRPTGIDNSTAQLASVPSGSGGNAVPTMNYTHYCVGTGQLGIRLRYQKHSEGNVYAPVVGLTALFSEVHLDQHAELRFVPFPNNRLRGLYIGVLGPRWEQQAADLRCSGATNPVDGCVALAG
jgi:hypothetical protein